LPGYAGSSDTPENPSIKPSKPFGPEAYPAWSISLRERQNQTRLSPEIIGFVMYQRAKIGLSGAAITAQEEKIFNLSLHKRTLETILAYHGVLELKERCAA